LILWHWAGFPIQTVYSGVILWNLTDESFEGLLGFVCLGFGCFEGLLGFVGLKKVFGFGCFEGLLGFFDLRKILALVVAHVLNFFSNTKFKNRFLKKKK